MQSDGYGLTKPYSDKTAELIDREATDIVRSQYERAKAILSEHAEGIQQLAQLLLDREVIYTEDVEHIFGKRPWISRTDELMQANASSSEIPAEETEATTISDKTKTDEQSS